MLALDDFTRYILIYQGTSGYKTDARGNRIPVTVDRTLQVAFKPKAAARTIYSAGADESEMQVEGACYKPRLMPREITNGQMFDVMVDGRAAKLTIRLLPRRALAELDEEFGQQFEATVRF